ncbi:MAG: SCO family protein [Opitutales bacterium]
MLRVVFILLLLQGALSGGPAIEGRVVRVDAEAKALELEVSKSNGVEIKVGSHTSFRVSAGDAEIGYEGRTISANANFYNKAWHLEQVFPLDGEGAKKVNLANRIFLRETEAMGRGKFLKEGQKMPNFGMINEDGDFVQMADFKGKAYVLNFIFTRCAAPKMCPASSTKMGELQEQAREAGLENLHFVTISFDPAFDSPGILRTYGIGYGFDLSNFHLLTIDSKPMIDAILRRVGILTMEEDGTINHTMATLLVDEQGRVAYREEGPSWKVKDFLRAAKRL